MWQVDPNTGREMLESDAIIKYLYEEYGGGAQPPLTLRLGALTTISASVGLLARRAPAPALQALYMAFLAGAGLGR